MDSTPREFTLTTTISLLTFTTKEVTSYCQHPRLRINECNWGQVHDSNWQWINIVYCCWFLQDQDERVPERSRVLSTSPQGYRKCSCKDQIKERLSTTRNWFSDNCSLYYKRRNEMIQAWRCGNLQATQYDLGTRKALSSTNQNSPRLEDECHHSQSFSGKWYRKQLGPQER